MAAGVLGLAGKTAGTVLRSKWFWIAIGAFLVFLIIWKYRRFFQASKISQSAGEKDIIPKTKEDKPSDYAYSSKEEIETLANKLYNAIYDPLGSEGTTIGLLEEANLLTDNELVYLSKHYRKFVTKDNWLYEDIDDEWLPLTSIDETVMTRLSTVGEKG